MPGPHVDIDIVVNPAYDEQFALIVARLSTEIVEGLLWHPRVWRELDTALRREYPNARVVPGASARPGERWYAYRDGRWVSPFGER